ncbi:MAG TPA: hypothetical protein VMZ53_25550 [Kofleriaceae bacterium]|nr:hypothetical protein [Kofleriaceae bacterium]
MRVRTLAPTLLALGALVAIYVFARHGDEPSTPSPSAAQNVHAPAPAAAPPSAPPPAITAAPLPASGDMPVAPPKALTVDEYAGHEPKAKKPKMTLQEELAETTKHISVMEKRATLIDQQVAELEKAGKTKEAAEQRVIAERLRKHVEQLREAVAAGRAPNETSDSKSGDEHTP